MRVTEQSNYDTVRDTLRRGREKMESLQTQAATTKRVNRISDDPAAASEILRLRSSQEKSNQLILNSKMAENFLLNTDQALSDWSEVVVRAKELALSQSSMASSSDETRMSVAEEIKQLHQQAVAIGNRRVGDRYIFGGYKTQTEPFDPEGNYMGDRGQINTEIGDKIFLSMNIPGFDAVNTHPNSLKQKDDSGYSKAVPENVNLFEELQKLTAGLFGGDFDVIRDTLERLDQLHTQLIAQRAKIGSRLHGLQDSNQALEKHKIANSMLNSTLEDVDMAQVVTDLNKEESVFKSALAASKRLIQPTLLDFLR